MSKKRKEICIKRVASNADLEIETQGKLNYPVFCFKHLHMPTIKKCAKSDLELIKQFIERLNKLSTLDWNTIATSHKHSFGWEKIDVGQLKIKCPSFVTSDVQYLLAFRYGGNNLPFLCLRSHSDVLHVIFIELHHGDVYEHT